MNAISKKDNKTMQDKIIQLIQNEYNINFGEVRFVLQDNKVYEIIINKRERFFNKK